MNITISQETIRSMVSRSLRRIDEVVVPAWSAGLVAETKSILEIKSDLHDIEKAFESTEKHTDVMEDYGQAVGELAENIDSVKFLIDQYQKGNIHHHHVIAFAGDVLAESARKVATIEARIKGECHG